MNTLLLLGQSSISFGSCKLTWLISFSTYTYNKLCLFVNINLFPVIRRYTYIQLNSTGILFAIDKLVWWNFAKNSESISLERYNIDIHLNLIDANEWVTGPNCKLLNNLIENLIVEIEIRCDTRFTNNNIIHQFWPIDVLLADRLSISWLWDECLRWWYFTCFDSANNAFCKYLLVLCVGMTLKVNSNVLAESDDLSAYFCIL